MGFIKKCYHSHQLTKTIQKGSGWSYLASRAAMKQAEAEGIARSAYVRLEGWKLDEQQMKKLAKREKNTDELCSILGCSRKQAEEKLACARRQGLSGATYLKYRAWELSDEERTQLAGALEERKKKNIRNRQWYADVVKERTGWTADQVKERLDAAEAKGYTNRKFITEGLYRLDEQALASLPEREKKIDTRGGLNLEHREAIKKATGWSDAKVMLEFLKAKNASGASSAEYWLFGMYKLTPAQCAEYITMEMHIKMQLRYIDYGGTQKYFENKTLFNAHFSEFVKRRWFNNENLTFEEFEKNIEGLSKIIYKPIEGIEGIGIEVFGVNESPEQNRKVFEKIVTSGPANVEEFLVQHRDISEFWPNSVNTIRIMSICKDGEGHILNAVIKFGTKSNVDNYYQGGIAAGIDVTSGVVSTHGVNAQGVLFEKHPYSDKAFKGFQIPNWDKVVEVIKRASARIPEMPYVGWDVAINAHGDPEIIEGNHNQGAYLIQYSFAVSNQEGRRFTIDPYLWFDEPVARA